MGVALMLSDGDAEAIVRSLRVIALNSFNVSAAGRLRLLADQIEAKIQTWLRVDQNATPSSKRRP